MVPSLLTDNLKPYWDLQSRKKGGVQLHTVCEGLPPGSAYISWTDSSKENLKNKKTFKNQNKLN